MRSVAVKIATFTRGGEDDDSPDRETIQFPGDLRWKPCCNFLTCFNSTLILLKTISYTDSLRTNNREMVVARPGLGVFIGGLYRMRSTARLIGMSLRGGDQQFRKLKICEQMRWLEEQQRLFTKLSVATQEQNTWPRTSLRCLLMCVERNIVQGNFRAITFTRIR
ncbi:hypothetical protein HID58_023260 [Brassica napus]|uniref:Uncharacterized protein n=1 Tax=Brassica napus TaxID=3708 RepID=A0ABQ8D2H3_BRANA|nr:hypothetical protein HID58_023260 [Brassica napus]